MRPRKAAIIWRLSKPMNGYSNGTRRIGKRGAISGQARQTARTARRRGRRIPPGNRNKPGRAPGSAQSCVLASMWKATFRRWKRASAQLTADFPHDALPWRFLYRLLKEQGWDAEAKDAPRGPSKGLQATSR